MGNKLANGNARPNPGSIRDLFGFTDIYLSGVMWPHLHPRRVDDVLGSCLDVPCPGRYWQSGGWLTHGTVRNDSHPQAQRSEISCSGVGRPCDRRPNSLEDGEIIRCQALRSQPSPFSSKVL